MYYVGSAIHVNVIGQWPFCLILYYDMNYSQYFEQKCMYIVYICKYNASNYLWLPVYP